MPVDDRTRLNLHRKLDSVLGPEEADTLMAHLPPVTWNEVATKDDLRTLEGKIDGLRVEMEAGHTALRAEMQAGHTAVRAEMQAGHAALRTELAEAITRQTRWIVSVAVAWSTLLVAVVRLLP